MPPLRTPPGVPRFRHLAAILREEIMAGKYPEGSRFPTEPELCERSGYSRETVRQAVRRLREEDLLEVVLGVGTFIRPASEWRLRRDREPR